MKTRAFTLIELMGVIIILGVIALIAIPTLDRQLKEGKEDLSENQKETIEIATKLWAEDNKEKLPESGEGCYVKYDELINSGYLEEDLKYITTGEIIKNDKVVIKVTKDPSYDKYTYTIEYKDVDYDETEICRYINAPYVKKGLVTLYDGINNTGNGHDSNSNIWKDLVGNKDINVSDGSANVTGVAPIWSQGNGLKFGMGTINESGNTYGYLNLDYNMNDILGSTNELTIYTTYWFDGDDGSNFKKQCDNHTWAFTNDDTMSAQKQLNRNLLAGGQVHSFGSIWVHHRYNMSDEFGPIINTNKKYSWAIVVTKNTDNTININVYNSDEDGNEVTSSTSSITNKTDILSQITKLFLGGGTGYDENCKIYNTYLYNFMVYNRALTVEEINKNFSVDKERYQLTTDMNKSGSAQYGSTDTNTYIP